MHRTRWGRSKDEQRDPVGIRVVAPAGERAPVSPADAALTPAEVHAAQRSATLTAAQSRRRGVLPG